MSEPVLVSTVAQLRPALAPWRKDGVALVPTMGALHDGHLALVAAAREKTPHVVVSIFVNPTQFAPNEDFSAYPRGLESDLEKLKRAKAELIFVPSALEMYPEGFSTTVSIKGPAAGLETDYRPHFFDGVATIVAKLFTAALPDWAVFGEKDYQQLLVVKRLVRDLNLPIEILAVPIAREADGLAMSSRNAYLSPAERLVAGRMNQVLEDAIVRLNQGDSIQEAQAFGAGMLRKIGFDSVDYVAVRDAETLEAISGLERPARILAAARIGKTRLIDNMAV